ncbi:Putative addiction module component [Dyadobacter soli]|uniref:Putative addiction module component n=2 Tax=Dyadobacter soli TaxID=659014 RepID=A0A1G7ZMN1_9BACT|nr:Putative addiction module component [Dyadobacter soli]
MKLQYSPERSGFIKSLFIPISEWNALNTKSGNTGSGELPEWHKRLLDERIEAYENGLEEVFDSEEVLKDIEKDLY